LLESQLAGVSLFFMLSGFILAYAYSDMETGRQDRTNFWISRFARIYPVYFLSLLWFAPFILAHRFTVEPFGTALAKAVSSFVPSALLIQGWFHPRFALSWNGPGWTLSVEAVFYILFPFFYPFIRRLSSHGKLLFFAAAVVTGSLLSMADIPFHSELLAGLIGFHPFFHVPTFLAGVALGAHFVDAKPSKNTGHWLCAIGIVAILVIGSFAHHLPSSYMKNAAFLPAFAPLLYGLALEGGPARILSSRVLVVLGESSYALYLLQLSTVGTIMVLNDRKHFHDFYGEGQISPILTGPAFFVVALLFSILVSYLVFRFIETPFRGKLRNYLQNRFHLRKQKPVVPFDIASTLDEAGQPVSSE
jgi:peptidoglycan/LPS O-acetylase OafA/YrhL